MQYKVPQHVDIEDKVIGSLTIRQFIITLVGVAVIGFLKVTMIGPLSLFFWPVALAIGGIFGVVAFGKYGDQNMETFLLSAYKTFVSPRKRVWQKEPYKPEEHHELIKEKVAPVMPKDSRISLTEAEGNLGKLAELVDSGGYAVVADGRTANLGAPRTDDSGAADILAPPATGDTSVDQMIAEASKVAPKREALISEAASVLPNEAEKETPTIKLRKDQFYKEIR